MTGCRGGKGWGLGETLSGTRTVDNGAGDVVVGERGPLIRRYTAIWPRPRTLAAIQQTEGHRVGYLCIAIPGTGNRPHCPLPAGP